MTFGFIHGSIAGIQSEAVLNSMIIGATVQKIIYSVPYEIDWAHEDAKLILAKNLQNTLNMTGYFNSCAEIWKW